MTGTGDLVPASDTVRAHVTKALQAPQDVLRLPPPQLDLTLRLMRRVRLLGRLAATIEQAGLMDRLPTVAADQLASAAVVAAERARVARWELDRLAWALSDLPDVPLVALKGCAYLLAGTPNVAGRAFGDVDLLVPEADLSEVERALTARGWRATELTPYDDRYYRAWAHELPPLRHVERGVEVDLHHGILMQTARLKPASALLFAAVREVPGLRFKVLAPTDMVLHAMTHLFYGGDLADSLRELVDIDDLLRHFSAIELGFWEGFWPRVEALDLSRPAFYGLRYARHLLAAPVPDAVLEASRAGAPPAPVLWLMDRLVSRALLPQHPDAPTRFGEIARQLFYVRSHWLKMPPLMLARHLAHKFYARRIKRPSSGGNERAGDLTRKF